MLAAQGATAGLTYGAITSTATAAGTALAVAGSALVKRPALWVLVGLATLLIGLFPRIGVAASWAVVGLMFLLELGWELGVLDPAVFGISPFAHVYPGNPTSVSSLLGLTTLAAALAAVGVAGFDRRDLT